jgi:hypothetical protein
MNRWFPEASALASGSMYTPYTTARHGYIVGDRKEGQTPHCGERPFTRIKSRAFARIANLIWPHACAVEEDHG